MNTARNAGLPIEVLLAEDSPGDVRLTQEALREVNSANNLHMACKLPQQRQPA